MKPPSFESSVGACKGERYIVTPLTRKTRNMCCIAEGVESSNTLNNPKGHMGYFVSPAVAPDQRVEIDSEDAVAVCVAQGTRQLGFLRSRDPEKE